MDELDDRGVRELAVELDRLVDTGIDGSAEHVAAAVLVAALQHFGATARLGALRTAVLSFERAPVACVEGDGRVHVAIGAPDGAHTPGGLLAHVRRRILAEGE